MKIPVIVVAGPTASGKTAMAVKLSQELSGEVISADSMQIYKGLSVGTAKPSEEEKKGIPHHMIDILDINESFSVADYCRMASEKIREIRNRGNVPVIAGGTGLYIDSLIMGAEYAAEGENKAIREELTLLAEKEGKEAVYGILTELDPEGAKNIHPNNLKRVIRAVEIVRSEGKPLAESVKKIPSVSPFYDVKYMVLSPERALLYRHIDERVDEMVSMGIYEEAKWLFENIRDENATSMQAIGYKEFLPYYKGQSTFEEAVEALKRDTRRYAKRQLTWFRRRKDAFVLDSYEQDAFEKALEFVKGTVK